MKFTQATAVAGLICTVATTNAVNLRSEDGATLEASTRQLSDFEDVSRAIVIGAVGEVPIVGGVAANLLALFWSNGDDNLMNDIMAQVESMFTDNAYADGRAYVNALHEKLGDYHEEDKTTASGQSEAYGHSLSLFSTCTDMRTKLKGSSESSGGVAHRALKFFAYGAYICISSMKERYDTLGATALYSDRKTSWKNELQEEYLEWREVLHSGYRAWFDWRKASIKVDGIQIKDFASGETFPCTSAGEHREAIMARMLSGYVAEMASDFALFNSANRLLVGNADSVASPLPFFKYVAVGPYSSETTQAIKTLSGSAICPTLFTFKTPVYSFPSNYLLMATSAIGPVIVRYWMGTISAFYNMGTGETFGSKTTFDTINTLQCPQGSYISQVYLRFPEDQIGSNANRPNGVIFTCTSRSVDNNGDPVFSSTNVTSTSSQSGVWTKAGPASAGYRLVRIAAGATNTFTSTDLPGTFSFVFEFDDGSRAVRPLVEGQAWVDATHAFTSYLTSEQLSLRSALASKASDRFADKACEYGLKIGSVCCNSMCGTCGNSGCGSRLFNSRSSSNCCGGSITKSGKMCTTYGAPCDL